MPIEKPQPLAHDITLDCLHSSFPLFGDTFSPGTLNTICRKLSESSLHSTSICIIQGKHPGPTICITAALHGDEINGIEIVRKLMEGLDPETLNGRIVAVPIVNLDGYLLRQRNMADNCDLNRCFPGSEEGSHSEKVAHAIFSDIIMHCDALIDLHTGGTRKDNLPQLRADLNFEKVAEFTTGFGSLSVLQDTACEGSIRAAATAEGIPAVVAEIGRCHELEPDKIQFAIDSILSLLSAVGITPATPVSDHIQSVYTGSGWVKAEAQGLLINPVPLGKNVQEGEVLAELIDPLTNKVIKVIAPIACTVLGKTYNHVVDEGDNLFQVGLKH